MEWNNPNTDKIAQRPSHASWSSPPPPPFRNVLTLQVPSHRSTPRECNCMRRTNAAVTVSHLYVLSDPIHKLKLKHSEASGLPRARLE